jgi:hypothetical protein
MSTLHPQTVLLSPLPPRFNPITCNAPMAVHIHPSYIPITNGTICGYTLRSTRTPPVLRHLSLPPPQHQRRLSLLTTSKQLFHSPPSHTILKQPVCRLQPPFASCSQRPIYILNSHHPPTNCASASPTHTPTPTDKNYKHKSPFYSQCAHNTTASTLSFSPSWFLPFYILPHLSNTISAHNTKTAATKCTKHVEAFDSPCMCY